MEDTIGEYLIVDYFIPRKILTSLTLQYGNFAHTQNLLVKEGKVVLFLANMDLVSECLEMRLIKESMCIRYICAWLKLASHPGIQMSGYELG